MASGQFGDVYSTLTTPSFYVNSAPVSSLSGPDPGTAARHHPDTPAEGPEVPSDLGRRRPDRPRASRALLGNHDFHSGSSARSSSGTNRPSTRIGSPSKAMVPPPYSGRWIWTRSQWTLERLPLSASS